MTARPRLSGQSPDASVLQLHLDRVDGPGTARIGRRALDLDLGLALLLELLLDRFRAFRFSFALTLVFWFAASCFVSP